MFHTVKRLSRKSGAMNLVPAAAERNSNGAVMASKRHVRFKQCSRKKKYESIGAARADAYRLIQRGEYVAPYGCRFCGGYHVGHKPKRNRKAAGI